MTAAMTDGERAVLESVRVSGTHWQLFEYQVRWKREGKNKRSALFSTRAAAERCVKRIREKESEDDFVVPDLEYCLIDERAVGEWREVREGGEEVSRG